MKKYFAKHSKKYISLSILIILGIILFLLISPSSKSLPTSQAGEKEGTSLLSSFSSIVKTKKSEFKVQSGDTFSVIMGRAGVNFDDSQKVLSALKDVFDIKYLQPHSEKKAGDTIVVHHKDAKDSQMDVAKIEIIRSPLETIQVVKSGSGFNASKKVLSTTTNLARKEGKIGHGQTFIEVALEAGVPYNVIVSFYDIFAFDLDFARDVRDGDTFSILYEEKYAPNGEYIGEGNLLYGSYKSYFKDMEIYRFEDKDGKVGYYDTKGHGAQKALKKTPINGARISSSYGTRRHPVLGFTRQHKGVDFAAPSGTPIPSAGDGVVDFRGVKGGYGNYIKVRHNGSYSTAYAHMSRFKNDVRHGTRVKQGQIIGYVGSTGVSTGPHLHYEIIKNGVHVNPQTIKMPSIKNLEGDELKRFAAYKEDLETQYALLNEKFVKFMYLLSYE
ncbi:MAG: M23 family metallopeptidase [Rickettsiales bacterium]|jgi:murein DD-endopeptidase MepM/ murein hydrolase activator NlpD|nr:M23 family metallopeptidase [Rickettsiales bacterium]